MQNKTVQRKVEVVPHDPAWREAFGAESKRVAEALGSNVTGVHNIGSTAIPGIFAKPIIDMLIEVEDILEVDLKNAATAALGYEAMGEYGLPGRRYFRKEDSQGIRTHHVHVFERGPAAVARHLAFRDYLRVHLDEAQAYSDLKRGLARAYPDDIESYMDGKDAFVKEVERRAARWRALSGNGAPS